MFQFCMFGCHHSNIAVCSKGLSMLKKTHTLAEFYLLTGLKKIYYCNSKVTDFAGVVIDCWKLYHHTLRVLLSQMV